MTGIWHANFALEGREELAPSRAWRLTFVRRVAHFAPQVDLLAFALATDHGHLLFGSERERAGAFMHDLECSLRWHLDLAPPFRPAFIKPVKTHRHLENVFHYVLSQVDHHDLSVDRMRETTNLPDLLGARNLFRSSRDLVRELLPRVTRTRLLRHYGIESLCDGSSPQLLTQATEGVAARGIRRRCAMLTPIKGAAIGLGLELGMARAAIARELAVHRGNMARVQKAATDEARRSVRLQLALMQQVAPETPTVTASGWRRLRSRRKERARRAG